MKVSVITVNLNNAAGLEKTVQSVLFQRYEEIEYIVIDGGSTDGSEKIIQKYSDKLAYFVSEPDSGIYNAMNKGIKAAHGDYLLFLNSGDCFYDENSVQKLCAAGDYDIIYGNIFVTTGKKKFIKKYPDNITFTYFFRESLPHPASLIRRKLLNENLYDESLKICADWKFFILAVCKNNATYCHVDKTISVFDGEGLSSRTVELQQKEKLECFNQYFTDKLISVIVPCYNQAQYLDECLQSVYNQKYLLWECIIVNDGSPDNTAEIAEQWLKKDSRFKYLELPNGGVSRARNAGIKIAAGKYILPLDADDKISKKYMKEAIEVFESDPEVKLVYAHARKFGAKNKKWRLLEYSYKNMLMWNMLYCSSFFKKSDFDLAGGYDETMRTALEDWDLWIRLLDENAKVVMLKGEHFFYRIKKSSRSTFNRQTDDVLLLQFFNKYREIYLRYMNPLQMYRKYILRPERKRKIRAAKVKDFFNNLMFWRKL